MYVELIFDILFVFYIYRNGRKLLRFVSYFREKRMQLIIFLVRNLYRICKNYNPLGGTKISLRWPLSLKNVIQSIIILVSFVPTLTKLTAKCRPPPILNSQNPLRGTQMSIRWPLKLSSLVVHIT